MHFVLILTAALTVCAKAAPQFNSFGLGNWRVKDIFRQDQGQTNNANNNPLNDLIHRVFPLQSTFKLHRRPNDQGQPLEPDNQRNLGQCWDPMSRTYKDWPNNPLPNQHTSQFYNGNFPRRNHYIPPMNQYLHSGNYWGGHHEPSYGHGSSHGHGYERPHDHGHGYRPPHDYGHGYGPSHNHGYGSPHHHEHGSPHYNGNGRPSLPPRPPHREQHENVNQLEICEESSTENVLSKNTETTTIGSGSRDGNLPYSSSSRIPSISTSVEPDNSRSMETVTRSEADRSVQTTTEFDWNNYFIGASADNTGGVGSIDIRGGGITAV